MARTPHGDGIHINAYTDDTGLTLFRVNYGDRVLQFAARVTDFELETRVEGVPLGLDDCSRLFNYAERSIKIGALIVNPPRYTTLRDPTEIEPPRKELES